MNLDVDVETSRADAGKLNMGYRCSSCHTNICTAVFIDSDETDQHSSWFRLCVPCYNVLVRKLMALRLEGKV